MRFAESTAAPKRPQVESQDGKREIDDEFYDDFPEAKRADRRGTLRVFEQLGSPINPRLQSPSDGEDLMLTRDWKYWIGALIACGLLTWFFPFGIVAGMAPLALCVHLLDRRQEKIEHAK